MPLLSCITTVFNEGPLLLTSVHSLLAQTMGDFELILVDDGSRPETLAILQGLTDPRIKVIRQSNDGLSSARNRALAHVTGDYICFLDADDSRPVWAFAAVAEMIATHKPDVVLCPGALQEVRGEFKSFYDQEIFDEIAARLPGGLLRRGDAGEAALRALAHRTEPQSANKFLSRDFLRRTGLGFPNGHFFEDIYFHTGAIALAESIGFLDATAFCYFRRHYRAQITSTSGALRFDAVAVVRLTLDHFAHRPDFADPLLRGAVLVACLKILTWCGSEISHHSRRDFLLACRALLRLIDPDWLSLPWLADPSLAPAELGDVAPAVAFLAGLEAAA